MKEPWLKPKLYIAKNTGTNKICYICRHENRQLNVRERIERIQIPVRARTY